MQAYQEARFEDLAQRLANGEELTVVEEREWNMLCAAKRAEEESEPRPWRYGGDYADVF